MIPLVQIRTKGDIFPYKIYKSPTRKYKNVIKHYREANSCVECFFKDDTGHFQTQTRLCCTKISKQSCI